MVDQTPRHIVMFRHRKFGALELWTRYHTICCLFGNCCRNMIFPSLRYAGPKPSWLSEMLNFSASSMRGITPRYSPSSPIMSLADSPHLQASGAGLRPYLKYACMHYIYWLGRKTTICCLTDYMYKREIVDANDRIISWC